MLDLGHNELMEVPEAIGELRGLSGYLYLNHNRLATLPVLPLHMVDNWLTPIDRLCRRFLADLTCGRVKRAGPRYSRAL